MNIVIKFDEDELNKVIDFFIAFRDFEPLKYDDLGNRLYDEVKEK